MPLREGESPERPEGTILLTSKGVALLASNVVRLEGAGGYVSESIRSAARKDTSAQSEETWDGRFECGLALDRRVVLSYKMRGASN